MKTRNKKSTGRGRLKFLFVLITLAWCVIIARLAEIQIAMGKEYSLKAANQSSGKITVKAPRGIILDRKGRQVAINVLNKSLYAYPAEAGEISGINRYLDRLYGWKSGKSKGKYSLKPAGFKWIDRALGDDVALKIQKDAVNGLYLKEEMKRVYPFGTVGHQLLGGTDIDTRGISGLEYNFDSVLAGRPGLLDYLRDAHRNTYRLREVPLIKPLPGNSIVLTVDWQLQEIVEEELRWAVDEFNALGGSAVFLDCHTGEILAAADYSPGVDQASVKLKAAGDVFEPGSIFKVFTAAALLDEDLIDFDEKIFCEKGLWKCGRRRLRDDKKHDSLNFREIFEFSSNIGIAKLAIRLGGEKLTETAKRFGFGTKTYAGLPGEQAGMIANPGVWSDYNIAALAIGHAISVTPLQLASAVSAVANGGKLFRPTILRGIVSDDGKLLEQSSPEYIGRVMDERNIEKLHELMAGVVERGTAMPAKSDIVSIGGKTGTAEVYDKEKGGYIKNRFNSSFMGFFPVESPKIAGIVLLHQPRPIIYGGHTAGPAFKNIAERYAIIMSEYIIPDTRLAAGRGLKMSQVPNFTGHKLSSAVNMANDLGLELAVDGTEGTVIWQYPPKGRKIPGHDKIVVFVQNDNESSKMMDFTGLKLRTALAVLCYRGLNFEIDGNGVVKKQSPAPGTLLSKNAKCRLICGNG